MMSNTSNHIMTTVQRPVVVDLFSGAGGMSLGFEASGFDIGASIEIDPIHSAVHEFNFPYAATICKNISDLSIADIEKGLCKKGFHDVDVIIGGPPCQGFSQIGKRQLDDPRNSLVFEYLRIVRSIRPKYFVFENVKGMILGDHKAFVEELVEEFTNIGYIIVHPYKVLNAADYGVAQNRHRFILIGIRNDQKTITYPVQTHIETKKGQQDLFHQHHIGSRKAIQDLEDIDVFIGIDHGIPFEEITYSDYAEIFSFISSSSKEFMLCHRRNRFHPVIYGHIGADHSSISQERFLATEWGNTEPISHFFKLHPERPSNTLRAGTDSKRGAYTAARPIHYTKPRCISIREGARLHSFPDWFQFHLTTWHGFRQLGNSVAPIFAKCIGTEIMRGLGIDPHSLQTRNLEQTDERLLRMSMSEASRYFGVSGDVIGKRDRKVKIEV